MYVCIYMCEYICTYVRILIAELRNLYNVGLVFVFYVCGPVFSHGRLLYIHTYIPVDIAACCWVRAGN